MQHQIHAFDVDTISDIYRHWHGPSQKYAGGDSLVSALLLGWRARQVVLLEKYWHTGVRRINIYHFELERADESMAMPVLGNPYVNRVIAELRLQVVPLHKARRASQSMSNYSASSDSARV